MGQDYGLWEKIFWIKIQSKLKNYVLETKYKLIPIQVARQKYQETGDERWKDGGSHKRKLDAAVAALGTALGGGSLGQVATAAISPELNAKIHELTKDNKTTNLLAHAALSALEAKATGHSATAGAAAGLIGEGSAMLLSETVLKKPTELLTAEERSLLKVTGLVAGAVAGGVVGGNTASATFGAETGKRAVENNFLSRAEYVELNRLMEKKILTPEEAIRVQYLLEKDKVLDRLLDAYQTNPDSLSQRDRDVLFKWVREYGNVPTQLKLLETPISFPQMKPDYSDLKLRAQRVYNYSGSVEGRLNDSLATGLSVVGTGGNSVVVKGIQYAGKVVRATSSTAHTAANTFGAFAAKYPNATGMLTDGTVALGVHAGYKVSAGQEINPYEAIGAFGSGALTRNHSISNQIRINIGIATVTSLSKDPSGNDLGNAYFGAVISPIINKPFSVKDTVLGNIVGGAVGEYGGDFDNRVKDYEELKKILSNKELSK